MKPEESPKEHRFQVKGNSLFPRLLNRPVAEHYHVENHVEEAKAKDELKWERAFATAVAVPFVMAIGLFLIACASIDSIITGQQFTLR